MLRIPYFLSFLGVLLSFLCFSCTSSKSIVDQESRSAQLLDSLVAVKRFVITLDRAMPMMTNSMQSLANAGLFPPGSSPSQIYLSGGTNQLEIKGDSAIANLSYFGERQMGGGYNNNDGGIEFKDVAKDWEYEKDDSKGVHTYNFEIRNKSETYQVTVRLFPNLRTTVQVMSNQRFNIDYQGNVAALEK